MGGQQSSPAASPVASPPLAPAPSAPLEPKEIEIDCPAIQKQYKECAALQYDRWLHPTRHKNTPPDYDECNPMFEAWKACVIGNKQVGMQFRSRGE